MKWFEKIIFLLPRHTALSLGRFCGRLAYYIFKKRRILGINNLIQSLNPPNPERIIKKLFENLAMNFIEFLRFSEITESNLSQFVTFHDKQILDQAYQKNQGVLVLTIHMGNWELLAGAVGLSGYNTSMVVKAARQTSVNHYLIQQREAKNIKLFLGKNLIKDILKQLKSGGIVGIVLDQHSKQSDGVVVPFFGRHASTLKSLALLSQRTNAIVLPMYIYRDENYHHHIITEPPIIHTEEEDLTERTAKYTQWIESAIKKHPDQWIWTHNRWKINR